MAGGGGSWFSPQGGGFWRARHVGHVGAQPVQPLIPPSRIQRTQMDWTGDSQHAWWAGQAESVRL